MLLRTQKISTLILGATLLFSAEYCAAEEKYMGAASCASSNCHGGVTTRQGSSVLQNEYTTWFRHDAHSRAYETLLSEESKKIAQHLGIDRPEAAAQCLACHSTFVPEKLQGEKFRQSDGVSCESCHGPAEGYLQSHRTLGRKHEENLKDGLRDLYSLEVRTKVCLECHQGTDAKTVNHRLIGAGHPRLTFELDTFSILQPNHWRVDEDYIERKGNYHPAQAWLVGQALRVKEMIAALRSPKRSRYGVMPELTNYYCYNCHHNLSEKQWEKREYFGTPGELHLNISSLVVLREALRDLDGSLSEQFATQIAGLHKAHQSGKDSESLKQLDVLTDRAVSTILKKISFSEKTTKTVLKRIATYAADTQYLPYEIAEQLTMAISALRAQLDPEGKRYQKQIDLLYRALKDEANYKPEAFNKAAESFIAGI